MLRLYSLLTASAAVLAPSLASQNPGVAGETWTPAGVSAATAPAVGARQSGSQTNPNVVSTIVPNSLAATFGNSNNNIPFSWSPTQYQQVFLGSEIPMAFAMTRMGMRQDNQFSGFAGQTVDLEINLGLTTFDQNTLTTTFASNFNSGSPLTVLPRQNVLLPNMPPTLPVNPAQFFICIPFNVPFPWTAPAGQNLLIQVTNRGNSNGNAIFTYPLDAGSGVTTTRLYGFPDTATVGTLGIGYGHVMEFSDGACPPAPTPATYTFYGTGCAGTGGPAGFPVPVSLAGSFGNSNNNIPFSWSPTHYQQAFDGSEMGSVAVITGLGMRQDDQFSGFAGASVDLEFNMGYTSFPVTGISSTYASNFNMAPPTNVLPRQNVVLPTMPPTLPTNPGNYFISIPFTSPFINAPAPGQNVIFEVYNRGNSNGNAIFTYPLDAGSGINTTRLYGFPDTATVGTLGVNYGHVMFFQKVGGGSAVPLLSNTGRPVINTTFNVDVQLALANTVAILFTGFSNTAWGAIPLPLDLTPAGAPGCFLRAPGTFLNVTPTDGGGSGTVPFGIPNDTSLVGAHFYQQYAVFDPTANGLGFAFTRGGDGRIGDT